MRTKTSLLLTTALLLATLALPGASAQTASFNLWEGETAVITEDNATERITVTDIDPEGETATLEIDTQFEDSSRTVRDDHRFTYVYRRGNGSELFRSVYVGDVSRLPPRVRIWLPQGETRIEGVSVLSKLVMFLSRLIG